MVETHDHAAPDFHTGVLDTVDFFQQGSSRAHVLIFLGFAERVLTGALDPDERGDEVGLDHQVHQLGVVGQVDRGFGEETQFIVISFLPRDHVAKDLLDRLLVADQVVIDDEDEVHARLFYRFELGDHLARRS